MRSDTSLSRRTIEDFGDQWTRYQDNSGFYGSTELLADILGPDVPLASLAGARIADIGSGTGRIVQMLLAAGVRHLTALEPSAAYDVLARRFAGDPRVTCLRLTGDRLEPSGGFDYVVSIGVLHHVPDPAPVVQAAFQALRPGGRFVVWLYGREGNELYLALARPLRLITTRLPHVVLSVLVRLLDVGLLAYMGLARFVRVPLAEYVSMLSNLARDKRLLVIYDQLKPAYAKYYTAAEAHALLGASFEDVTLHHRRGYSWTVVGTKAAS